MLLFYLMSRGIARAEAAMAHTVENRGR